MTGPGDPLPRVLDAWRAAGPWTEARRDHVRDWWPDLGSALDALAAAAPEIPQPRVPVPDYEAAVVVASLVRRYGDPHPDEAGVVTAKLYPDDLETLDPGTLTVLVDPGSGALYLRHKGAPTQD